MSINTGLACCSATRPLLKENPKKSHVNTVIKKENSTFEMVYLSGGEFRMGTNNTDGFPADGEGPIREVNLQPFYMDKYAVTNAEYLEFVTATNYKTEAEHFGWSFVFYSFLSKQMAKDVKQTVAGTPWWAVVEGAYWGQPEGADSSIANRLEHPVVHISWNDALAYCKWIGKRLPTEAEWEYAARGGLEQNTFPWGNELTPNGEHQCNIWQGEFPNMNTSEDGYAGTAPVDTYKPNDFGLYNMSGNVWEWCSDWFATSIHNKGGLNNPKGPQFGKSKVMRGGSYLCHKSYCNRYRVAARSSNTADSSTGNIGFRCVVGDL
ncbi:formylglycine-generating enzyme family protein [Sporosarcina sp. E16_3]|uniref:formylglycine-generating enzyme family protein n=1 Tax=Sporosarcina sp. E16_3 TaxID=2789293 RepID=UPI001A91E787|nr:formylglycine-generating enzyme family protein [Sporosarcina sp. E16_3]MBO0600617.1 formylglycine-generating enzyme family protein [Sporosarcina sp. E16_3]